MSTPPCTSCGKPDCLLRLTPNASVPFSIAMPGTCAPFLSLTVMFPFSVENGR